MSIVLVLFGLTIAALVATSLAFGKAVKLWRRFINAEALEFGFSLERELNSLMAFCGVAFISSMGIAVILVYFTMAAK